MNTETTSIHTAVAALSAAILAILGVDYYALIWAFVGALWGLTATQPLGRSKALLAMALSTAIGAAVGTLASDKFGGTGQSMRIVASLVIAAGAQQILPLMIRAITGRLERLIGKD